MRGMGRGLGVALAIALAALAVGLTACGGGSPRTATGTDPDRTSGESSGEQAAAPDRPGAGSSEEPRSPSRNPDGGSGEEGGGLPAQGNREFLRPDGDNSVQTFGTEAASGEREAASIVLERYLAARSARDERAVCRDLSGAALEALEGYAGASLPLKGKTCPEILAIVSLGLPPEPSTTTGSIESFRVEGDRGFALYHGSDGDYFIPMVKEEGAWKVGALAPVEIP
jgi:hypothetical protein